MPGAVTTDENILVTRDYTDNFSVKKTAIEKLGPKYFEDLDDTGLNVGVLGFTLEQIANITEDSFNTAAILVNEAFPNKAVIPESIYSHAAIFQLDNTFTTCGVCKFIMLLVQEEVLRYGEKVGNKIRFYIDKNTVFSVEDIPFTFDYTIQIEAMQKQITGSEAEYNYSAKYVLDGVNAVSNVNDPYLKIRKFPNGLLAVTFSAHQVERTEIIDTITKNTRVNYPVLTYDFSDSLAGFDIYYKAPSDSDWVQLRKKVKFSLPIKDPFCYYRLKDTNVLEITFTTREGYFQPEFNSDIRIVLYTTIGKAGEFETYIGNHVEIMPNSETYGYNDEITISIKPSSDCTGAKENYSLEALQALTVEAYCSATEISNENDLSTYFYNHKYRYDNEIYVIKRRDDITERLYSAFLLVKNQDYIYPTNTLSVNLKYDDFDTVQGKMLILKPGHLFVYDGESLDTAKILTRIDEEGKKVPLMAYNAEDLEEAEANNQFVYTNPFLISINTYPNVVGLYSTLINQNAILDFISANDTLFTQFIASNVTMTRSLTKKQAYHMSLTIAPSSSLEKFITTFGGYEENMARVIVGLCNSSNEEVGYIELYPEELDPGDSSTVKFGRDLETIDDISNIGTISITNAVNIQTAREYATVPIKDAQINVYILFEDGITRTNIFSPYFEGMEFFTISNVYSNRNDKLNFVIPMNMMRSTVIFTNMGTETLPVVNCNLSLLPMIKADLIQDEDNFAVFIDRFSRNYEALDESLPLLRNNTNLDVKFYNTYGRSINYYIGDDNELIDRVNLTIKFQISLYDGVDDIEVTKNVRDFIKSYIEQVNSSGTNDLYISNLIRAIENKFPEIHHQKFLGINEYSTDYQTIMVKESDLNNLTKEERRKYVPEILVVEPENVQLTMIIN